MPTAILIHSQPVAFGQNPSHNVDFSDVLRYSLQAPGLHGNSHSSS
ncbi:hypothetical protein D9613_008184 [Agrocybe pediades]|uniref:Uncharacterized protein n=1 Tax=Agrocybe pediades TaxID=84607 RepID=A0A8H4QM11_9AGAR|nr:hypothetical protein D9613_008184 [Agrocybe pediades]